jgi:hypothetical protein
VWGGGRAAVDQWPTPAQQAAASDAERELQRA